MLHQGQVSHLLDEFDGLGAVDQHFLAVLGEPCAAVGQGPDLHLPGPVVDKRAVLHDVVLVEAILAGVLAVLVKGQAPGDRHELIPGIGLVGGRIGLVGSVEHVLVVVQDQDLIAAGVADGGFRRP